MTEPESAITDFVLKDIARTKDQVPWITNKLKKQLRKQKRLLEKQRDQVSLVEHPNTTQPTKDLYKDK